MNLFQKYLVGEFAEEYEEGRITRREALKLIVSITGSLVVANSILAACSPPPQDAEPTQNELTTNTDAGDSAEQPAAAYGTVEPDDPRIEAEAVEIPSGDDLIQAYLARPKEAGSYPVILVCHENRGLTDHIRDVTRRFAAVGYAALAVDLLSRQGGSDVVGSGGAPGALGGIAPDQFVQDFRDGWSYLQEQTYANADRVGMVGFCFGGGVTWRVATQMPELRAAIPFYGPQPDAADVPGIQAAVLAIYGELDQRINQGIPAIEAAMAEHQKTFEKVIYPDSDHAFFNDTGSRYNPEAAQDAWDRVLAWFGQYLG